MNRLKKSSGKHLKPIKTGFFGQFNDHLKIHFHLIMSMLAAYATRKVCELLFDGKGIGWILNLISDSYIVTISIFVCISYIIKVLKS